MEIVGNFHFCRSDIIGQGASGIVFKGCSILNPNQTVAVKAVKKKLGKQAELLNKEIQILKGLTDVKHENIVALLDCKIGPQHVFLIMEFCNGGNLEEYLQSRRMLPESTIAHFLRQIASAMKLFNCMGIVHRDMKPQNILLCCAGQSCVNPLEITLKIADFGFARFLEDGYMAATLCGSPLYMAPEVFMCQPYDGKADLWSVATIVYQCLTGVAPFVAQTPQMLRLYYERTAVLTPSIPHSTSAELKNLLLRMLKRNPKDRMDFESIRNPSHQHKAQTANDQDEVFQPFSQSVLLRNKVGKTSPIPRRRRVVSSPGLCTRPQSPCLDDFVIIPSSMEDSPDDDSKSSGTTTPTNSYSVTSSKSGIDNAAEVKETTARGMSQPVAVPPRRGSLPNQPCYKHGASLAPFTSELAPALERHASQPILVPMSHGSPRTRTLVPRCSFTTLPALDEGRPHFEFPESPSTPYRTLQPQWHGSARLCQPGSVRRSTGLAKNSAASCLRSSSPTSPVPKEQLSRCPSYSSIPSIESMSPPSVQFVVGSSSPPPSLTDVGCAVDRRHSSVSPTHHLFCQGFGHPLHQCSTEPALCDARRLLTQRFSVNLQHPESLSSSPHMRYLQGQDSVHDIVRFKPSDMEGPVAFVAPELSDKTLLNEEHNSLLDKIGFVTQLARVIAAIAHERSSPLAESIACSTHCVRTATADAWKTPPGGQVLQFEDESRRWAEQMVLYVRALQLLSSALHVSRCALLDGRLERVTSARNAVLELNTCYQECLTESLRLKAHAEKFRCSLSSSVMVTADELMYSSALERCKLGAMDEELGNMEQCVQHYRDAYILFHGLSQQAHVSADKAELDKYRSHVERRLRLLHGLGFVQINR